LAEVLAVALHEKTAGFIVEGRLGERHNKKTLDYLKDVGEGPLGWVPVSFKGVDADVTVWRNIGVENLGEEKTFRRFGRKLTVNN